MSQPEDAQQGDSRAPDRFTPSPASTHSEPDALVRCFYQDPWWEDLTAYISQERRRINPQAQPLSTTLIMNYNLEKIRLFNVSADTQPASPLWAYLLAITSAYVESWHKAYHRNVPEALPQLYAVCLWIDMHTPECILYHEDVDWLAHFLHERLVRRSSRATLLGEPEIDFSEYNRRYLQGFPTTVSRSMGVALQRKPDERPNPLFANLMAVETIQPDSTNQS